MALSARTLKVGDTHEEQIVNNLTRTQLVQYAGASGDYNPVHTDEVFTTKVAGYPSVFAHGMLSMGMTGKMLTNYVGDGRLTKYGVRFTRQVWPGDTLTVHAVGRAAPDSPCSVLSVELLGSPNTLTWSQDDDALRVRMPAEPPGEHAFVFKIRRK